MHEAPVHTCTKCAWAGRSKGFTRWRRFFLVYLALGVPYATLVGLDWIPEPSWWLALTILAVFFGARYATLRQNRCPKCGNESLSPIDK
jgi:hypothetical protein